MKIHRILVDCNHLEFEDEQPKWLFRVRAQIEPGGKPKMMQRTYTVPEEIFREQIIKTFQQIGMDLSMLHTMDEGAI